MRSESVLLVCGRLARLEIRLEMNTPRTCLSAPDLAGLGKLEFGKYVQVRIIAISWGCRVGIVWNASLTTL